MPLFRHGGPLSDVVNRALIDPTPHHRRIIAKGQHGIHAALHDGEMVVLIAIEHVTETLTLVVTDRRLLVMRQGGLVLDHSVEPPDMQRAVVKRAGGGAFLVVIDGPGTALTFHTNDVAHTVANSINSLIRNPTVDLTPQPRTIPTLYPRFFLDLLAETGMPATPTNLVNFIDRVFVMLQGEAGHYFTQAHDPAAQREFTAIFDGGGPQHRVLRSVDDMVDWLWDWNPLVRASLAHFFPHLADMLRRPHSFLHSADGKVTPWSEWSDK
jgi:hypothetical protein